MASTRVRCRLFGTAARRTASSAKSSAQYSSRRASPVAPGIVTAGLPVPPEIPRPPYIDAVEDNQARVHQRMFFRDDTGRNSMRKASAVARDALAHAGARVAPGVTTAELDAHVHDYIVARGAYPSPLGYMGFPKSCCTSVNEVVLHGIPDDRPLRDGDIVNIDVSAFADGVHGDTSRTFLVNGGGGGGGESADSADSADTSAAAALVAATEECLAVGIALCEPGVPFTAVGEAVHAHALALGYDVVREFTGHGIGAHFHMFPHVLHTPLAAYLATTGQGEGMGDLAAALGGSADGAGPPLHPLLNPGVMEPGMAFTIEPALTERGADVAMWSGAQADGWTVVTRDGGWSAQAEHTLLMTEDGVEVLTAAPTTAEEER